MELLKELQNTVLVPNKNGNGEKATCTPYSSSVYQHNTEAEYARVNKE